MQLIQFLLYLFRKLKFSFSSHDTSWWYRQRNWILLLAINVIFSAIWETRWRLYNLNHFASGKKWKTFFHSPAASPLAPHPSPDWMETRCLHQKDGKIFLCVSLHPLLPLSTFWSVRRKREHPKMENGALDRQAFLHTRGHKFCMMAACRTMQ